MFQHVETFDEENLRDFVDVYLKEIASSKDPAFNGDKKNNCLTMLKTPTSALLKELTRGAAAGERHGPLLGRQRDHGHNLGVGGEWLMST